MPRQPSWKADNGIARKSMFLRLYDRVSWPVLGLAVLVAVFAWMPSLRFGFGAPTEQSKRGVPVDFALPTLDGGTWSLSANRGKVVLVNFWATWCPPCRAETPDLVALKSRYASQAFEIVGINMDEDQGKAKPFVEKYRVNYPILLPNTPFGLANGVSALPTTILLDRDGRVAREYVGMISERALRGDIDTLLGERRTIAQAPLAFEVGTRRSGGNKDVRPALRASYLPHT